MPSAEATARAAAPAAATRDGEVLRFSGALLRDGVAALWRQALPLARGARRFDLSGTTRVDSAGVALLAELAARAGGDVAQPGASMVTGVTIDGNPPGLAELRAAYRLRTDLAFA